MSISRLIGVFIVFVALGAAAWLSLARERVEAPPPTPQADLPPDDGRFRWGVQIRPFALNRYTDQLMAQQLDLAKELGVHWIRLDWHRDVKTQFNDPDDFVWHDKVIDMAHERGLHVVLILEDLGVSSSDVQVISKASAASETIANHYKGRVKYYQVLNEVSGSALKGPSQPGTDFMRDFDQTKYRQIRDLAKGIGLGIERADPAAKLILSGQWTHTAMFEQLIRDGVSFDIIGWNWFSDMGEDLNGPVISESLHQKITLLDKLRGFGKELWITELNYRPGPNGMDEAKQAAYLKRTIERIYGYQTFKALFVFELPDQSEVKSKGNKPEYYGLVKFDKDSQGNWTIGGKKQAFDVYKQVIAKLSRQ